MIEYLLLALLLILSAIFSGSETAFLSSNKLKLEVWIRQKKPGAKRTFDLVEHPEKFLVSILIGNNIAVVAASSILAVLLIPHFNGPTITILSATILLIFGEILPKSIAADQPTSLSIPCSWMIQGFNVIAKPLVHIFQRIIDLLNRWFHTDTREQLLYSRKDLEWLIRDSHKYGVVDLKQQKLLSRFLLRGNQPVRNIMIPRPDITAVHIQWSLEKIRAAFKDSGYSRLPVYREDMDDIVGMLLAKDIILNKPLKPASVMRNVLFTPEQSPITSLLKNLRHQASMAIIVDEYGGTAGLVTIEDIIEEFFGEIEDEHDDFLPRFLQITPSRIDVHARVEISELNHRFGFDLPTGEYQTVSGYLLFKLGYIPKKGETIDFPRCRMRILSASKQGIHWIRIIKKPNQQIP